LVSAHEFSDDEEEDPYDVWKNFGNRIPCPACKKAGTQYPAPHPGVKFPKGSLVQKGGKLQLQLYCNGCGAGFSPEEGVALIQELQRHPEGECLLARGGLS
jgi:hypothetical protein